MADNIALMIETTAAACTATPCPDLLVFLEYFLTGYHVDDAKQQAITLDTAVAELRAIATTHRIALTCGYIKQNGDALHNAALLVDADGEVLCYYRKRCLYGDWDKNTFAAGDSPCVFDWRGWRIGVCICYDIEFSEITRQLTAAGAELIIAPTALMAPDEELVFALLPARAIENGVFVAYANRVGHEKE